ncbi:MAG: hypothetical protein AAF235_03885 [Planctomycetota bacterium]
MDVTGTMGDQKTAQHVPFPVIRLIAVLGFVLMWCGILAFVLCMPFVEDTALATVPPVLAVLVGSAIGVAPLAIFGARPASQWAMPIVFCGMMRMLVAVGGAAWIWLAAESVLGAQPHRLAYWGTFLASGLAVLIAESAVAVSVTRKGDAATGDTATGETNTASAASHVKETSAAGAATA